ncbi:hypothetical protein AHAS_Ahas13G0354100 [Arachis hypogaea]
MRARVPQNFKSPDMDLYDRMSNLSHHLSNFRSRTYLADTSNATCCKAFPTTLTKASMKWFDGLPPDARKTCLSINLPSASVPNLSSSKKSQ